MARKRKRNYQRNWPCWIVKVIPPLIIGQYRPKNSQFPKSARKRGLRLGF